MATLLAHITVRSGAEGDFEAIARTLYDRTHTLETGVRRYEYWRGAEPRTYGALLAFDDHRTFIAHQVSEHHEEASPQLGRLVESIRLEWVDPITGASPLPPTASQPPVDGASELAVAYTDRFAAAVADWWLALRA